MTGYEAQVRAMRGQKVRLDYWWPDRYVIRERDVFVSIREGGRTIFHWSPSFLDATAWEIYHEKAKDIASDDEYIFFATAHGLPLTYGKARERAEELARCYPTQKVYLTKAVEVCRINKGPVWSDIEKETK